MITATDIIKKLIKDKGYKSIREFCDKFGIDYLCFRVHKTSANVWTKRTIDELSKALDCDLSFLINS